MTVIYFLLSHSICVYFPRTFSYLAPTNSSSVIGTITTVAGIGSYGYSGDGGLATAASIGFSYGIAFDGSSNLYLSDNLACCLRMVKANSGIITTVAGNGLPGYSGDGGFSTAALLSYPTGIAIDDLSGNIYIADTGNNRVRMITKRTGIITTVAGNGQFFTGVNGGSATGQAIGNVTSIALDSSRKVIYILVDLHILMISESSGNMTLFAGRGDRGGDTSGDGGLAISAAFDNPRCVAVDVLSGNVYIADINKSFGYIRMVTKSTGIITRVAGSDVYGVNGGSALLSHLSAPNGIAVDIQGDLYITVLNDDLVRKITMSTGIINTVAGTGVDGSSGDGGLATDAEISDPYAVTVNSKSGVVAFSTVKGFRIRSFTVPKIRPRPSPSPTAPPTGMTVILLSARIIKL